jgi:general secretion pathway protein L
MFLLLNKSRTNALAILDAWTGTVAATIIASLERMVSPRVVQLFENETGEFVLEAANKPENVPAHIAFVGGQFAAANLAQVLRGSRVEIVLRPMHFLFARSNCRPARPTSSMALCGRRSIG